MANKPTIPDFPTLPDFGQMITQACEVVASVRGIPYDFNGTLSLENKFVVLFKTVKEMFDAQDELVKSYKSLYDFINNYFTNLDVQKEINIKIDALLADDSFWAKLNQLLPFVTPEMFGAVGDSVTDDYSAFQNMIDHAIQYGKEIYCYRKTYKLSDRLFVTGKISFHGGNATLLFNGTDGIIFNSETRSRECIFENFTIDGISAGKVGMRFTNYVNSVVQNIWFYNMLGTGILFDGENFETKIDMINFNATTFAENIGINCSSTDIIFSRINGVNIKTFIINNADGNMYTDCHAWLANSSFFAGSLFADCKISALFEKCIVDTYETGFKIKSIASNRFVSCNWLVNTDLYNKLTANKVPTFIEFIDSTESGARTKLSNCWFSMPSKDVPNWFNSLARIFNTDDFIAQMSNCFIANCADNIYNDTHYSNVNPMVTKINTFRSNIALPIVQVSGEALGEFATGSLIFTLPANLRPSYAINIVGGCRVAGTQKIKACNYYIGTNGKVYITYDKGSDVNSNSFFFNFIFCK